VSNDFTLTTELFRIAYRDGSLWIEYLDGVQGDGCVLVPDRGLDDLIATLKTARDVIAA
jgi:hypothetical protein